MSASPIFDKINADIITAMKSKDEASLSALRMLKSAIKYKEVDLKREVKDEDVIDVLSKQAKQRRESIEGFEKGGRADAAAKEKADAKRIKQLESEIRRKDKALAETAALLILKKKVLEIWGDGDDDTKPESDD